MALERPVVCWASLCTLFLSGCFLNAGPIDGSSSTGGGAGSHSTANSGGGGTDTTSSSTSQSSTGGSTTSATSTDECTQAADCTAETKFCEKVECKGGFCTTLPDHEKEKCDYPPATPSECEEAKCEQGACKLFNKAPNTVVDSSKNGDCKQTVCDSAGKTMDVADPADVPEGSECSIGVCSGTFPSTEAVPNGESCGAVNLGQCCKGSCCAQGLCAAQDGCCVDQIAYVCGGSCCTVGKACCAGKCCAFGQHCNQGNQCVF
ncbi:MAG: hypothetical protein IPK82_09470 [Polyangiaceae bacterium]|nr:hypothetical protein [Polyangiaceae bacterium]